MSPPVGPYTSRSQSPAVGVSVILMEYGPKAADGGMIFNLKLSHAELFGPPQPPAVGGITLPVHVTVGMLSETVPLGGVAASAVPAISARASAVQITRAQPGRRRRVSITHPPTRCLVGSRPGTGTIANGSVNLTRRRESFMMPLPMARAGGCTHTTALPV